MKYRHSLQGEIHELRKGNYMIRNSRKGEEKFRKEGGRVEQIY
jgi:hypothetical protein